jgi:hypothetical protein
MTKLVFLLLLAGTAIAVIWRRRGAAPAARPDGGDGPARLLGWATGLLAAGRAEWGQAMLGELDSVAGRALRWRFAAGCVAGVLVVPPWGRAAAVAGALAAVAAGGFGLAVFTEIHYGLGGSAGTWIWEAIVLAVLAGYSVAAIALARRPGVAGPGLAGGLFVAVAVLAGHGWSLGRMLTPLITPGVRPLLLIVVPAVVGAGVTLWTGGVAAGGRAAALAAVSAGLGLYLYGVLAVAVVGAGGPPGLTGATVAGDVSDRLGNQVVFALVLFPLATAAVGGGAVLATAWLRGLQPGVAEAGGAGGVPALAAPGAGLAAGAGVAPRQRAGYLVLTFAVVAGAAVLALLSWLPGR